MNLNEFRNETRAWIQNNLPKEISGRPDGFSGGNKGGTQRSDHKRWFDACYERGFTVPSWPKEYGGAGLDNSEERILREEMAAAGAPEPLGGMGVTMIGPTLLEYGTEDQRQRHLSKIASGEIRWCQGYSEPNAGSDLASLQTRAVDEGDHYLVNGSKIWTSGANFADWIFCLVRTEPDAPKHEGISFVLFSMDDPGVSVKPIVLIAGNSPFCQCFFDDVKVAKNDLIGQENRGWTVAKRLLQHERSMISGFSSAGAGAGTKSTGVSGIAKTALKYYGEKDGRIGDIEVRSEVTQLNIDSRAFSLTARRAAQESSGGTPTFVTSMFKYYATELGKRRMESLMAMRGADALGWEGKSFDTNALGDTRQWLMGKAGTIAGGSSEVQLNIIAKRVLGLPD